METSSRRTLFLSARVQDTGGARRGDEGVAGAGAGAAAAGAEDVDEVGLAESKINYA